MQRSPTFLAPGTGFVEVSFLKNNFYLCIYFYFWLCWIFIRVHCDSDGKESICSAGDLGSIPRLERFPAEGNGNPFHYSCLANSSHQGSPVKDSFSMDGVGGWFWKNSNYWIQIQIIVRFYFYYYYISYTSGYQALDPRGWRPLV